MSTLVQITPGTVLKVDHKIVHIIIVNISYNSVNLEWKNISITSENVNIMTECYFMCSHKYKRSDGGLRFTENR